MGELLKIVLFSIAAAVVYGIVHDMVTAHLCVEYFSVAHPHVIDSESPVLLALVWGVLATWWMGLGLGLLLAIAARAGSRPPADFNTVRRAVVWVMVISLATAIVFGVTGAALFANGLIAIPPYWAEVIAPDRQLRFMTAASAHQGSYLAATLVGLFMIVRIWRLRT